MIAGITRKLIRIYAKTVGPFMPMQCKRILRKIYTPIAGGMMAEESLRDIERFYRCIGIVREDDLVFDVGANRGVMAEVFLKLGARVVCVDPDPRCAEMLRKKFAGNQKVSVLDAGLGSKPGELELSISEADGVSTFSDDFKKMAETSYRGSYTSKVKAKVTTLDALIEKHGTPKYCKIDVEGYEQEVLLGLHSKINYISFEFHRIKLDDAKKCAKLLEKLGDASFNWTHYDPTKKPLCSEEWMGSEELFRLIESENPKIADGMGDINFYRVGDIFARME